MKFRKRFALVMLTPILMADFPVDAAQLRQADDLWAGLHGKWSGESRARIKQVRWLLQNQDFTSEPIDPVHAAKLVSNCLRIGSSQITLKELSYDLSCHGNNAGILFKSLNGSIVSGTIVFPPPIILAPNPADRH